MSTEFESEEHELRVLTSPRTTEVRSRPTAQRGPAFAAVLGASRLAGLFLMAATSAGCVASNYDFDALSDSSFHSRGARLSDDLVVEQEGGEHEELFDIDVIPLARTHLNVFSESEDERLPGGYVEADIDAYFPLFGFVDATIHRYDSDHRLYESHEYDSYLWGLFQTHREQVDTRVGLREKKMRRFLWFFDWRSSPKYIDQQYGAAHLVDDHLRKDPTRER